MKKIYLSFFLFFLIMPAVFADITIKTEQPIYNLGNKIRVSASVLQDKNFEGLLKLAISCENYKLQYFLTPISLEANFRTAIAVPEVTATSSMLGSCIILGDLTTNDNLAIEEKESNSFSVTNQLNVLPVNTKIISAPDDSIHIAGIVNEAFGNNVLKASTNIDLDNNSYPVEAVDGKFNANLVIPKNIKSGKHTIGISASDSKNNIGKGSIEIDITAVPSYIKLQLSGTQLAPGAKISITSSLFDQADDLINASLDLELTSPKKDKAFRKVAQSNEKIDYEFSQYAEPGLHVLVSTYKNLRSQASINITTIREVKIIYENESVFVENVGNIPFQDELTFILQSGLNNYPIIKKINIEPGKLLSIDLSKEVPLGIYDVVMPTKKDLEPIKEKILEKARNLEESAQESINSLLQQNEKVLANNVTIHDNRPAYKKFAGSFASISSSLVGSEGALAKYPLVAPSIVVLILLVIVFRYGRKPIMKLIRGKKDDKN